MHLAPALKFAPRSKQTFDGSMPWPNCQRLARMRSIGPVAGTPESSSVPAASLAKSASAENDLTSPARSASAWALSRHQAACTAAPAAESPSVKVGAVLRSGNGSWALERGPTLTIAAPLGPAPPGVVSLALPGCGARYALAALSHRPTPIVMRTLEVPGSHAACGTRTSIWRRVRSTAAVGAGCFAAPAAPVSSAVAPWTVRNSCAGEETPAPCGQDTAEPELPSAMVKPTRSGSLSVLRVTRKAVASGSARPRSSTRSAALWAYTGSVGYVYEPAVGENRNALAPNGLLESD